jgi:hypothetical protein
MRASAGSPVADAPVVRRRHHLPRRGSVEVTRGSREPNTLGILIRRCSVHVLLLLGLAFTPTLVLAQTRSLAPAASALFAGKPVAGIRAVQWEAPSDTVPRLIRPTYWKEGALIGGVIGGVSGGLWLASFCGTGCAVGSALLLVIPGALVGGQFSKPSVSTTPRAD